MKTAATNTQNKRDEKRKINIRWNSRLFFQIGIIVSLLIVFFVMESSFKVKDTPVASVPSDGLLEPAMINYVMDVDKPKAEPVAKKTVEKRIPIKKVVKSNVFDVKPNTDPVIETPIVANIEPDPVIVAPTDLAKPVVGKETNTPKNINFVEFVPVFPGCESLGSNSEKVECMSSKINLFITRNFRRELLENLNANETQRVYVNFKIDENGIVTDVVAQSRNERLKKEAQRIINKLPVMKPGRQGETNVAVLYSIPITLKVQ